MKLDDAFNRGKRAAEQRHADRLYDVNRDAGFGPDDARRCADRDTTAGKYRDAFPPSEDPPVHPHRDAPAQLVIPFDWPVRR